MYRYMFANHIHMKLCIHFLLLLVRFLLPNTCVICSFTCSRNQPGTFQKTCAFSCFPLSIEDNWPARVLLKISYSQQAAFRRVRYLYMHAKSVPCLQLNYYESSKSCMWLLFPIKTVRILTLHRQLQNVLRRVQLAYKCGLPLTFCSQKTKDKPFFKPNQCS